VHRVRDALTGVAVVNHDFRECECTSSVLVGEPRLRIFGVSVRDSVVVVVGDDLGLCLG
jgi:hypothetical protein